MALWNCGLERFFNCYKQSLTDHSGGSSKYKNMERHIDVEDHQLMRFREDQGHYQDRNHACFILAMNLAVFCPWPEKLDEAELKGNRLL